MTASQSEAVQPLKDAGGEQKGLYLLWLPLEHLLSQIVQDIALVPTEFLEQGERIGMLWQGKTEELQTDQPALRASCYLLDCLVRQLDVYHFMEEGFGLLCGAAQLVSAHFQHLLTCSELGSGRGGSARVARIIRN